MKTEKFPCPLAECGELHGLCYLVGKNGKRRLGVNCSYNRPIGCTTFRPIPQAKVDQMDESEFTDIPVFLTPEARKADANKGNLQFVMSLVKGGEAVERNVETMSEDDKTARRLLKEIDQFKQAQSEITKEIEKLARKRGDLETAERQARAELRAVWTEPLNFKPE